MKALTPAKIIFSAGDKVELKIGDIIRCVYDCPFPEEGLMPALSAQQITDLLQAWSDGDQAALERLMPLVYDELHRMAKRYMRRERSGHTLQTTALIHETYLRLIERSHTRLENRAHFFAISAQLMRQILVDFARSRRSRKRGGDQFQVSLGEALSVPVKRDADLVALDDSLRALAAIDERKCRIVELRFFGGLSEEETADVLNISPATVRRDWKVAKVWLLRELKRGA
jgi:RNA polymerase sigma factor (TIGR02999 family)